MKQPIGPHQMRGRRRRRGKAAALVMAVAIWAAVSSMTVRDKPPEGDPGPDPTELAYALNVASMSPGHARAYAEKWPEYAAEFMAVSP